MDAKPALACLRLLILAYRRRVSGRGPMRWVGCSFAECESCSAYGLRSCERAPHVFAALARIRARLRRCRELALYRVSNEGHQALAWGRDYDDSQALEQKLREADELPRTRWAVLDAARQLAAYRGQWELEAALHRQRDACLLESTSKTAVHDSPPRVLLRHAPRLLAHLRARARVELGLLASLALLAALLLPPALGLPLALLSTLQAAHAFVRAQHRRQRFARQLAAARFTTSGRALLRGGLAQTPRSPR